jgi:hypothetical protein
MAGVLLLACGILATVIGWRTVRRVRALTRRITSHYHGPQVPVWVRRVAPWRLIPGVGEAVIVWNRRAKLAKLLALPLLLVGPLLTALGALLLVDEVHTAHALVQTLIELAVFVAAAALVRSFLRRGRRAVVSRVSARQDQV